MQTLRRISQVCRLRILGTKHYASTRYPEGPVYEIRFYQMKPEKYRESLALLEKYWPARAKLSTAIGSWMSEVGGICETVHIWEYANLEDRMARRERIAKDEEWSKKCLPTFLANSHTHNNVLATLVPNTKLVSNVKHSDEAIYELKACYLNGGLKGLKDAGENVIGHFITIGGPTPTEYMLLRYTDADEALQMALKRPEREEGYSRLMVPCRWSALK